MFVVRDRGEWLLTPVPVSAPTPVRLDDLVSLLARASEDGGVSAVGSPQDTAGGTPLAPGAVVGPVWKWVGVLTSRGVALEGNGDDQMVLLDRDDLRLLDALRDRSTVADLAEAAGVADAPARLGRLVAAGRLKLLDAGPEARG